MPKYTTNRWGIAPLTAAASTLVIMSVAPAAIAQEPAVATARQQVNIPAGPLDDALITVSEVFGVTIIAPNELVSGKATSEVSGALTAEQALLRLLAGTGLEYTQSNGGVYIVRERDVQTAPMQTTRQSPDAPNQGAVEIEEAIQDVIIVRGQRVERTEFETSTSVSVFTTSDLNEIPGTQSLDDALVRIPNIVENGVTDQGVIIRGVSTSGVLRGGAAATGGARPRASTIVDGRVQGFQEFVYAGTSVYDIEQIEVYRGPQTIAQGVNSIAGAIFVFTKDPTFEFEAGGLAEVAENDGRQFAGFVSGPLIADELAFRFAADYRTRNSFIKFDPDVSVGPGSVSNPDADPSNIDQLALRGKLLWEPGSLQGLSVKATISYTENETPSNEFVVEPFEDRLARDFTFAGESVGETIAGIIDIEYDFGNGFSLTNQTTLSDYDVNIASNFGDSLFDGDQVSNETLISYDKGSRWNGLAGLYYFSQDQADTLGVFGNIVITDDQENLGIFGRLTVDLTDRLELTSGLRYQRDSQDRQGALDLSRFGVTTPTPVSFDETFDAFLPKIEIAYDVTEDIRIGASAARGFNPGGFTVGFFSGVTDRFDEETVWTYDAFARTRLLEGRLQLDGNIFYSDYDGFQKTVVVGFSPINDNPISEIDNVDSAETYGLELSFDFAASSSLSLFGSLGILETSFEELTAPGIFSDFEFSNAPGFSALIGVDFEPLTNLNLNAQFRHTDDFFSDDANTPVFSNDSFNVVDLSARYDLGQFSVFAFWENIFDDFYTSTQFSNRGSLNAAVGPPSRLGAGIEVSF